MFKKLFNLRKDDPLIRNQFRLLRTKRLMPLLSLRILSALNNSIFIFAIIGIMSFAQPESASLLPDIKPPSTPTGKPLFGTELAVILTYILPFILFGGLAGQIADKYDKIKNLKQLKTIELALMVIASLSLFLNNHFLSFTTLFCIGTIAAFASPIKNALVPELIKRRRRIGANAMILGGFTLAALIGALLGNLGSATITGTWIISALLILIAICGRLLTNLIPQSKEDCCPDTPLEFNFIPCLIGAFREAKKHRSVYLAMMGVGWFYLTTMLLFIILIPRMSAGFNSGYQPLAVLLSIFALGIILGSLVNNYILKSHVTVKYVPFAAFAFSLISFDMYFSVKSIRNAALNNIEITDFIFSFGGWHLMLDLVLMGIAAGIFIVPLYALIQTESPQKHRGRILAASNIYNASFIIIAGFITLSLIKIGLSLASIFALFALAHFIIAIIITRILPDEVLKALMRTIFTLLFRVEVKGIENYTDNKGAGVIICNHVSFLDAPLLASFLPGRPMFAINTEIAKSWWVKPWLFLVEFFPLDPTNPMAAKGLIEEVAKGKKCIIFPEGRLTTTGALMKVYEGPGMIIDKANATMLPTRIDGVQHTLFTRLKGKLKLRPFPKITITVQKPVNFKFDENASPRDRRHFAGEQLYDIMSEMIFKTGDSNRTLYTAMLDARANAGGKYEIIHDIDRVPLTFNKLRLGSQILGRKIKNMSKPNENIGILLPNSTGSVTVFFSVSAFGRVPTMLNFSTGAHNLISACNTSEVKTILTSKRFIEKGRLEDLAEKLENKFNLVYLEDVREKISGLDKIFGLITAPFARYIHAYQKISPKDTGVILFTSGSEGAPKAVLLSHKNMLSNIQQIAARVDFNQEDILFNALPMFHSFGLTGGTLLPLLYGVSSFQYPSPLHYRIVSELVYSSNATIMFGTDTFLTGYAKVAHPYDFYRMRYIFAGAESLRAETRKIWNDKFGVRIFEGYGATECAPVLAVNTPMHYKAGTVGRLLPGIEHRLETVEGVDAGGKLVVKAPNVMRGYYMPENPAKLVELEDGWYDTGDIVNIDKEGFVSIVGRAKRFAKIAGEMVSLGAAENLATETWPENRHAAVALSNDKKGERVILLTDKENAKPVEMRKIAKEQGYSDLMVPKSIKIMEEIPLLSTGKIDYVKAKEVAEKEFGIQKSEV